MKITKGPWKYSPENDGAIFGDLEADYDGDNPFIGRIANPQDGKAVAALPKIIDALYAVLGDHESEECSLNDNTKNIVENALIEALGKL